jgi:hypothetical protein
MVSLTTQSRSISFLFERIFRFCSFYGLRVIQQIIEQAIRFSHCALSRLIEIKIDKEINNNSHWSQQTSHWSPHNSHYWSQLIGPPAFKGSMDVVLAARASTQIKAAHKKHD